MRHALLGLIQHMCYIKEKMPEIYSMSRWNTGDEGGPEMRGDKVVHSAKKAKKKSFTRGCPGNDMGPHFHVLDKEIRIYTVNRRPGIRTEIYYDEYCLLCEKKYSSYWDWSRRAVPSLDIVKTDVITYGKYVRDEDWRRSGHIVLSKKTYDGEYDG